MKKMPVGSPFKLSKLPLYGAVLLTLTGCSSESSDFSPLYQLIRQGFSAPFGGSKITREEAAAIEYASLGYRVGNEPENLLILATNTNGDLLWTSAAHVVILTRNNRITRSVGLPHNLGTLTAREQDLLPPIAALKSPFTSTRLEDFPDIGYYGVSLSCAARVTGKQTITILGQDIATVRVDESCSNRALNWSFIDSYWLDPFSGLAWRSQQHIHPRGDVIEIETFRPPS